MYTPAHFAEADTERIAQLIADYGFATLLSVTPDGLQITHAPVQLDRSRANDGSLGTLVGHIARANPHAAHLVGGAAVIAIIHGPHGYISPTWYATENPKVPNVPTWNYANVHLHGKVRLIDDEARKWKIVADLAAQYEEPVIGWNAGELANHASKLNAIIGFEVDIERVEAKSKLSQNRPVADQESVIEQLAAGSHPDGHAMAKLMRENLARRKVD
ncbi:MAG: FMN-binding negative transcriptional regulator [Betaproteobacteria bacterium]|nr:FMN-binding negative transcriptional regulator [Betaproteobacteria bacterium]